MVDTRAAKRYARALFSASAKEGVVARVDDDLKSFVAALNGNASFKEFFTSPIQAAGDKTALIQKVFGAEMHPLALGLVRLAVEKGRDADLTFIQLEFSELRRQSEKIVKAVVESAQELADDQRGAIVSRVAEVTGRTVEAEFRLNPDLIGGVKVYYDDYVLDGTVRGHLDRLRERFYRDALKQA
ncbi:MAG: ATP synthase F1 subunit delta [Fimbriimonadaceae bacterium]|nr:ATP synthase F1 subunit delta [Fimbriimonadaceae bacterium]